MSESGNGQTGGSTVGEGFHSSPAVQQAIATITGELREHQQAITGVRGPVDPAHHESFEAFMERAAGVRGRPLLYPYIGSGIGNGPYVEMMDGSVKLDMICGIGVHFFGHSDPDLTAAALEGATSDIWMQGHLMQNEDAIGFASTLLEQARKTSDLAHVFLCNSGAMANENCIKVCYQKHEPASRVLAFSHCFMGRTVTMAQLGDSAGGRSGIPLSTLVDYVPFYDHVAARRMSAGDVSGSTRYIDMCVWHLQEYIQRYPKQHACFIFELVQGEGGFNTALPEFHRELMQVCKDHNIAVWSDEVQTFGRTEQMFCFEALGLGEWVDVCAVGKMSQVCAAIYTSEYNPRPGLLSGTFLGSTTSLRVGRRALERLRDGGYYGSDGKIAQHFRMFKERTQALIDKHPDWFPHPASVHELVSGYGGMMRFTPFGGEKDPILKLCKQLYEDGLIAFYCGHDPFHVRMLPPLGVMEEHHWDAVFEIFETSMSKVYASLPKFEAPSLRPMHASPHAARDAGD
ncbi:MAG: aminotransferase class III-fold pyridoxal phosphate-dependent enzyme [Planctomycetota bacterium]